MTRDGSDPTLPASNPGTEATLASDPAVAAMGETMASEPGGSKPPAVIRAGAAGRTDDYDKLIGVDPTHYVVGKELARGGMGRIMTARDRRLGRAVAIKELLYESRDARARFEREARITARLQHPSIVNILEAGTWPSGEPFYVMKLVDGTPLDKVITQRKTLAERLGLLPHIIAVVDALAYAHAMRVIHRDLKPGNVLVGAFGETVVIDWGLAKDLTDTSGEPDVPVGPYRDGRAPGETVAGAVMGTPAYMPPEQAAGDKVDERADVYALGAMLYHVLAGAPPYSGKTTDELLAKVLQGPPPPLASRADGIPPDLVTIVEKAMAPEPTARYLTAAKLADDLKKFQTGQLVGAHQYSTWQLVRRWIRRHRAPVAVAAIAATALAVVGVVAIRRIVDEQARTERQRLAAVASRGEAEGLMDFMLGDLKAKLEPLGKLDLLADVAQRAVAYYDARGEALAGDELARRGLALRNLGEVLRAQGDADAALRELRASLAIAEQVAAAAPDELDRQADVAIAHDRVAAVIQAQGDTEGALAAYQAARAIREALLARDPTRLAWKRDLAISHSKIAKIMLAKGDTEAALALYREQVAIDEELVAKDPGDVDRQRDLAVARMQVGNVLLAQGDRAAALATYRTSLTTFEALVTLDPDNVTRRRDVSVAHYKIANVLIEQGDTAGGLVELRAALAQAEAMAARDPTNADRQADLWANHTRIGDVILAQGDTAGALVEYRKSLAVAEAMAARDPTNTDRQRDLSFSHERVGDVLAPQGDLRGALAAYRAGLAIVEQLAAADPANTEWQEQVAGSLDKVGNVLRYSGDLAGGLAHHRRSLAINEALAAKDPTDLALQRGVVLSRQKIGEALLASGDAAGAEAEYRAALALAEAMLAKDATHVDYQRDAAFSHGRLGDIALGKGDAQAALSEHRTALKIIEAIAATDTSHAGHQTDLAERQERVADALAALGQRDEARALYASALAIVERAAADDPTNADVKEQLDGLARKKSTEDRR